MTTEPMVLHSLLGNHPNTKAQKSGQVSSPLVQFDYFEVKVANTQFKAMVREQKYDFGELAIVTFLQAKHYGKPYVLLPATIVGRNQHHTIFYNAERGRLTARDLNGKRLGVRAYTQTTGCWVRGFLSEDYGVDLSSLRIVTFEDPHLAEYRDPPNVERAPEGKTAVRIEIIKRRKQTLYTAAAQGNHRHPCGQSERTKVFTLGCRGYTLINQGGICGSFGEPREGRIL